MSGRKIEIGFSEEEKEFVHDEVSCGRFADEAAVVHAGLKHMADARKLAELRAD